MTSHIPLREPYRRALAALTYVSGGLPANPTTMKAVLEQLRRPGLNVDDLASGFPTHETPDSRRLGLGAHLALPASPLTEAAASNSVVRFVSALKEQFGLKVSCQDELLTLVAARGCTIDGVLDRMANLLADTADKRIANETFLPMVPSSDMERVYEVIVTAIPTAFKAGAVNVLLLVFALFNPHVIVDCLLTSPPGFTAGIWAQWSSSQRYTASDDARPQQVDRYAATGWTAMHLVAACRSTPECTAILLRLIKSVATARLRQRPPPGKGCPLVRIIATLRNSRNVTVLGTAAACQCNSLSVSLIEEFERMYPDYAGECAKAMSVRGEGIRQAILCGNLALAEHLIEPIRSFLKSDDAIVRQYWTTLLGYCFRNHVRGTLLLIRPFISAPDLSSVDTDSLPPLYFLAVVDAGFDFSASKKAMDRIDTLRAMYPAY